MKSFGNRNVKGSGIAKLASGIPLVLLALAAAIVAIAGISVARHAGNESAFGGLGFTWFVIAATFFVLGLTFLYLVGSSFSFVAGAHSAIVGLLAIVTVLCILETQRWDNARSSTPYSTKLGKGAVTAFAGYLALAVLLALLIMVIGNSASVSERKSNRDTDVYQTTQVHSNPAHATGPATATAAV